MRTLRLGTLALVAIELIAAAAPASAATCRRWQMRGQTFFIEQSDGFTIQVTPGAKIQETDDFVRFGTNGSLVYERTTGIFGQGKDRSGGSWVEGIKFSKTHPGYVTFRVYWNSGLTGQYFGNIHNPRYHDGALIADLKGWISSGKSTFKPDWKISRSTPIFCFKADEIPDVDPRAVPPIILKMPDPPPPPPPEKRVISHGGKANAGVSDPNRVGQFDLPFESESSLGGKFDVKFQVVGMFQNPSRFHVTGTITNTDIGPQYNGTFDGTMSMGDTRTVMVTYIQPAANAGGTVVFRFSEDGETFVGDGMHGGNAPFKWTGRRKR